MKKLRLGRAPQYIGAAVALGGLLLTGMIEDIPQDTRPVQIEYAGDYLIEDAPSQQCQGTEVCGEVGPPMNSYLDAYNWCDAEYGDESPEAIDCQIAAYDAWYPAGI